MNADIDTNEFFVTIKNWSTLLPYVDPATGITSANLAYESCDITDVMYEPRKHELSTATVTFPSLMYSPHLRGILSQIQEGDRVEIYKFQPDSGDPIMAGYIPPNGLTESSGRLTITAPDSLVRGQWTKLRKYEEFDVPASGLYSRALSRWYDIINEDFSLAAMPVNYSINSGTPVPIWEPGVGWVLSTVNGQTGNSYLYLNNVFTPGPGDTYLFEAETNVSCTDQPGNVTYQSQGQIGVGFQHLSGGFFSDSVFAEAGYYAQGLSSDPNSGYSYNSSLGAMQNNVQLTPVGGTTPYLGTLQISPFNPFPIDYRLVLLAQFTAGQVTLYAYNNTTPIIGGGLTFPWNYSLLPSMQPYVQLLTRDSSTVIVSRFRVRKLVAYILQAARFNPQTSEAILYSPNSEDNLSMLQYIAEQDGAEWRLNFKAAPQNDEIELDGVGLLGNDASALSEFTSPAKQTPQDSPAVSPFSAGSSQANYLGTPPLRFEEGYNLADLPKKNGKATEHANDIIRMGSGTQDSQMFAEAFSTAEVGNPVAGVAATYPYFETTSNDDRTNLYPLELQLCQSELGLRLDKTPSLELSVVDTVENNSAYRAGDKALVATKTLLSNVEQSMRIVRKVSKAGDPKKAVTVGKLETDPAYLRTLLMDTRMGWLYDQSGSSPLTFVYPYTNFALTSGGANSTLFQFALDKFTSGTAIISANLHWFMASGAASSAVANITTGIASVGTKTAKSLSATLDSGSVDVSGLFPAPGTYGLYFSGAGTCTVLSAYLVLRARL